MSEKRRQRATTTFYLRPLVMSEGQWTLDIEAAWAQLFKLLTYLMKSAYDSDTTAKDTHNSNSSSSKSNSGSQELAKAFPRQMGNYSVINNHSKLTMCFT